MSGAAEQFQRLQLLRLRIGTMDMKIAAIALANDATLLTRNLADFGKVPGLRVEDWTI
jgi:tRNA(fMet)-specific endonuclease VapC